MSNKKTDNGAYLRHMEFTKAGYIKDRYAQVKSLSFHLTYVDPDNSYPSCTEIRTRDPSHSAHFKLRCPHRECLYGGHDLTDIIHDMLTNRESEQSGSVVCQGWQDRERLYRHRCLLALDYKVSATYNEECTE